MVTHDGYVINPKRTRYGDIYFRSKLEARWAVFMDLLGVEFQYEPECEEVETGCRVLWYKPDFFLPEIQYYVEIKPRMPNDKEFAKGAAWSNYIGAVIFFYKLAPDNGFRATGRVGNEPPTISLDVWRWCECPRCLKIDICELGLPECSCYSEEEHDSMFQGALPDVDFSKTQNILKAFKFARCHDFATNVSVVPFARRPSLF